MKLIRTLLLRMQRMLPFYIPFLFLHEVRREERKESAKAWEERSICQGQLPEGELLDLRLSSIFAEHPPRLSLILLLNALFHQLNSLKTWMAFIYSNGVKLSFCIFPQPSWNMTTPNIHGHFRRQYDVYRYSHLLIKPISNRGGVSKLIRYRVTFALEYFSAVP